MFTELLLCARLNWKSFMCIHLFNPYNSAELYTLTIPILWMRKLRHRVVL